MPRLASALPDRRTPPARYGAIGGALRGWRAPGGTRPDQLTMTEEGHFRNGHLELAMRYTFYTHPYVRQSVLELADGDWVAGLANGTNAWDTSNFTVEEFVRTTWRTIPPEDAGCEYVKDAWKRDRHLLERWTEDFIRRIRNSGFWVCVDGANATIDVAIGVSFANSCARIAERCSRAALLDP